MKNRKIIIHAACAVAASILIVLLALAVIITVRSFGGRPGNMELIGVVMLSAPIAVVSAVLMVLVWIGGDVLGRFLKVFYITISLFFILVFAILWLFG